MTFQCMCGGGMKTSCICMVLGCVPSLIKSPHYLQLWILVKDMFRYAVYLQRA